MEKRAYTKAPIVEAVVEFRISGNLDDKVLERCKRKFHVAGWISEDILNVNLNVNLTASQKSDVDTHFGGYRISSTDGLWVIQLTRQSLVLSRLPPYCGWDEFVKEAKIFYGRWRKIVGTRVIERIGLRYLNRIDIPIVEAKTISPSDYVTFFPTSISVLEEPARIFQCQVSTRHKNLNFDVNLISATIESVLIGHSALLLDCDVHRYRLDVPQSDSQIWEMLTSARNAKNDIFEACITEKTRRMIT
jgi:uncharacterized protein (TIGR04255 family)